MLRITNPAAAAVPRAYILCTAKPDAPVFAHIRTAAPRARTQGWHYRELPTGHLPMLTAPRELADLLLEVPAIGDHEGIEPGRTPPAARPTPEGAA